ncbi:MAG: hypothetical protein Q4E94_02430, partial [Clostridia bacterium]|nr:hypothetical protein [Clostridia bacterium]
TATPKSKIIIYVAYRDDAPVEISCISLSEAEETVNITVGESPEHIKVFLWSDDGYMIPYCAGYEL